MRRPAAASTVAAMTADLFLGNIQQGAPMMAALLAIAGVGWLAYRVTRRRRSDRSDEE
jgi:hypothetical protein